MQYVENAIYVPRVDLHRIDLQRAWRVHDLGEARRKAVELQVNVERSMRIEDDRCVPHRFPVFPAVGAGHIGIVAVPTGRERLAWVRGLVHSLHHPMRLIECNVAVRVFHYFC